MKRIFLIVLDSFGIGEMEDAASYGDVNVSTIKAVASSPYFHMPNMGELGLFDIEGVTVDGRTREQEPEGCKAEARKPESCKAEAQEPESSKAEGRKQEGGKAEAQELESCKAEARKPEGCRSEGLAAENSKAVSHKATVARMTEASKGKDTTIGHWEIAGVCSARPLPVYPEGFPKEVLDAFRAKTGRGVLCNLPYSGTKVIQEYGDEHMRTGDLIVYTSADSVFQIAAHEEIVPPEQLYEYCRMAREILRGEHGVGRVIARPFEGPMGGPYTRTSRRHDFSIEPPAVTMLDQLKGEGKAVIAVGKIRDIFAGQGITEAVYTSGNDEGIRRTLEYMDKEFEGLCFINLVDFDMLYGHRRDIDGYAKALSAFDESLPEILGKMREDDILMITADHGCDPAYTATTDHTREYTPFIMYGKKVPPRNLGTRKTFADIGATVLQYFGITPGFEGKGMLPH